MLEARSRSSLPAQKVLPIVAYLARTESHLKDQQGLEVHGDVAAPCSAGRSDENMSYEKNENIAEKEEKLQYK